MPLSVKKKVMLTGVTGLGTLGLILAGFAWWDARTRRVARADDIVQSLGMNLVGILPALPTRTQRRALARRNAAPAWEHMLMESVDATRTMLLHASRNEQVRVVMVTSAVKGEGKTSLASHLATSLARARQRTLLIDGDLRSPTLHTLFDLTRGPGLAELLRGECDMVDALQATPAPSLTLITGGHVDSDAIASLAEGRLQPILAQAREQFDFIIVDSAPVLPVADSLQICQHVDAVLFSVLRDVSRLPKIHAAYERLASLGVRFLGAVVAGTKTDRDSYYAAYPYASTSSSSTSL
jgi:capsular exopolysaccharide synthesis family protein